MTEPAPSGGARAALTLGLVALLGLGGLLGLRALTAPRIAEQEREVARRALAVVLPPGKHDNDPNLDRIEVHAPAWLGRDEALPVRRARLEGHATARLFEAVAPDGYNGDIRLLIGVDADGRVLGVRVLAHRETPGLGDAIEAARSDWIRQFDGRSLDAPALPGWRLRRDGGEFDQLAGATITPRAVLEAVRRVLQFDATHGAKLDEAPRNTTLAFDDAPEATP